MLRVTVAVAVDPSTTVDAAKLKDRAGPLAFRSSRLASAEPWVTTTPAYVSTLAVMTAVWLPMSRPLLTAAIGKLADSCPASITTDVGTVAAVVSLLPSTIVSGWLAGLAIETVPVVASAPAASLTVVSASVRLSVGTLSSTTTALSEPLWKPLAEAVIVAVSLPSICSSLTTVTGNVAEVAPAGIVTVAGTVSLLISLLRSETVSAARRAACCE